MRRIICSLSALVMLGAILALPVSPSASAYTDAHCRKTYLTNLYLIDSDAYVSATSNALVDWKSLTPVAFAHSATSYDIWVRLGGYGNSGWDAQTFLWCGSGVQTDPSITYFNSYYTATYTPTARRQLASHEIGHALGLDHWSSGTCLTQAVMYFSSARYFTCGIYKPQPDDVTGIDAIY